MQNITEDVLINESSWVTITREVLFKKDCRLGFVGFRRQFYRRC